MKRYKKKDDESHPSFYNRGCGNTLGYFDFLPSMSTSARVEYFDLGLAGLFGLRHPICE